MNLFDRIRHPGAAYRDARDSRGFDEVLIEAGSWCEFFQDHPAVSWGLHLAEVRSFAPAWLGLLAAGKDITLLPHAQSGLLLELEDRLEALVLDAGYDGKLPVITPDQALPENRKETVCPPGTLAFFTSGSTGKGQAFIKELDQLLAEVAVLESCFGEPLGDGGICSTVSHQHIYGFLFTFLWPLVQGRCVWSEPCAYPSDIEEALEGLGGGALVSTPSMLKRLPELMDWTGAKSRCTEIFSSGGPLPREAALALLRDTGRAPVEVFGSTETGGVAWRRQHPEEEPAWKPFPGIQVRRESEGRLQIASPFVHDSECPGEWYTLQDRVERVDGGFRLQGRADRIVKIEQKRVSLEDMEQRLVSLPEVEEAAVLLLDSGDGKGRSRLGAVLVLSTRGEARLHETGPVALHRSLRAALQAWFELTVLPRAWRQVERMPENQQGKRPLEALRTLFTPVASDTLPTLLEEKCSALEVELQCRVPEQLRYFDGHFAGLPVVAGVVQIQWAMELAEKYFDIKVQATLLEAIKFQRLLFPNDSFTMTLKHAPEKQRVHFALYHEDQRFSSGRVVTGLMT